MIQDFFEGSCVIEQVNSDNWRDFLSIRDFVFVMFYHPFNQPSKNVKDHFATAAQTTSRAGVTFAAVNCFKDRDLCVSERALFRPEFAAYHRGRRLVKFSDPNATSQSLTQFVEGLPVPVESSTPVYETTITFDY